MHTRQFMLLLCLLIITLFAGCRPQPEVPAGPTPGEIAARSWISFISDIMGRCEANCCVDYQAFEEYEGQYLGITVVGYRDSEYIVNLFRYDPEKKSWVESPRTIPSDGYPEIDIPAASEQWGVPEQTIQRWLDRAEVAVRKKYSSQ